jgi:hypothetical protein
LLCGGVIPTIAQVACGESRAFNIIFAPLIESRGYLSEMPSASPETAEKPKKPKKTGTKKKKEKGGEKKERKEKKEKKERDEKKKTKK